MSNPQNWVYRGSERMQKLAGAESASKGKARGRSGALDFLRRSTLDTAVAAKEIRAAARTAIDGAQFPAGRFAQSLRSVARMIAAGMETKVYYVLLCGERLL